MARSARRVDRSTIALLHQQIGIIIVRDGLQTKIQQVERLATHSLVPGTREPLAALLRTIPLSGSTIRLNPLRSHTTAEQAFVLIDAGATRDTVDLLHNARRRANTTAPPILRAWLAAAHGEGLAAHLLPNDSSDERPYVTLNPVHLARWRGHALARFGHPDATTTLTHALNHLDPSFVRAETALRIELATALAGSNNQDEIRAHAERTRALLEQLGSKHQHRHLKTLAASLR